MPRHNAPDSSGFRARAILSAIFMMAVLFAYQNCGIRKKELNTIGNRKITNLGKLNSMSGVRFIDRDNLTNQYIINMADSTVTIRPIDAPDNDNQVPSKTCAIDNNWHDTLSLLFNTIQICRYETQTTGMTCTQQFTYAHTHIQNGEITYKLGEMNSGCPPVYFDVCENLELYLVTANDFINIFENCTPID